MDNQVYLPVWGITLIIGIFLALLGMVWAIMNNRVSHLENEREVSLKKLIDSPLLSFDNHEKLCNKTTEHFESYVDASIKLLTQKIDQLEENLTLKMKNAILEVQRNGRMININKT